MNVIDTIEFIGRHPLTRQRRLAALTRLLSWQIRSRLRKDLEVRWVAGTRVIARNGMTGFTGNIYCGLHEYADMGLLLHLLRPGDGFIDIGANVGSYTILASGVCHARTVAFEPDPDTARFLRRNIEANGLADRVIVHEMALGDSVGVVNFSTGRDTMNQVMSSTDSSTRQVSMGRLDDISEARGAVLVKIDVEGFEEHVLGGAGRVLAAPTLLAVQSESQTREVVSALARHGFEQAFYDPGARTLSPTPLADPMANGLFIRDWEAIKARVATAERRKIIGQWV
ncbi:MAG TPA: FkbM family methyltransferase [Caulobacteraceae bacterium]|jgi:FkbM family methyltransferase